MTVNRSRGRELLEVAEQDREQLKMLLRPNGNRFTLWFMLHFGIWVLLAGLIFIMDNPVIQILLCLLLGNQLHALTILQHDCGHGSAYERNASNQWVGKFLAWFIILPFTTFTEAHKKHHKLLGDPKGDPDEWFYSAGPILLFFREWFFVPRFIFITLTSYGGKIRQKSDY